MIIRTLLISLLGFLGIVSVFGLGNDNYLTPEILSNSIIILSVILLIDLWNSKWQEPRIPKIDAHTESLSFTAHQLRSPLTVIKGYADLIEDGTFGVATPEIKDASFKIKAATNRAFKIIDEILNFNSLLSGKTSNKPEIIQLNNFLSEHLKQFEQAAHEKNLILSFEPNASELKILADSSQLEHIVNNILDNALKYTDKGKIEVRTTTDAKSKFATIEIFDTGKGIPAEIIETIFMPFERDPRHAHDVKGMGLGLSIAKKLSEINKFKIWAKSDGPGTGAAFYIKILLISN